MLPPRALAPLAALLALTLAGCGGGGADSDPEGKTVLRYARWGLPEEIAAEEALVRLFEERNPDIDVKVEYTSWAQYTTKLQAQMAANTAPDVFLLGGTMFFDYLRMGQVEDLTDRITADPEIDLSLYYTPPVDVFTVDGRIHGLPRDCNTIAVYYNKTLFEKHGVPVPTDGWTWDDLLEAARRLTVDENGDGRPESFGFLASFESMEVHWGSFVWQNGGELLNEDRTRCLLGEPAAIEALDFYSGLVTREKVSPDTSQTAAFGSQMFLTGRLAMSTEGSWMINEYRNVEGFEWGVAPLPAGKVQVAPVNGLCHVMSAGSGDKDAAWRFLKFLASEEYQRELARLGASIPALRSVAESEVYLPERPEVREVFLAQLEDARPLPFTPRFLQWEGAIRSQLELVWLGRKDIATACRDAAAAVDAILAGADAP